MATIFELIAGFFTGKTYRARDFARSHKALITNGVLADNPETFQVVPSSGMTVAIKTGSGFCWIEGHYAELESTAALTLTTADGVLNRIDRIVARLDTANGKITLSILTGTTAAAPTAPALTRNGTIHELCLADIYVAKGTTTITAAMITDTRSDSTLCGGCLVRTADLLALAGKADKVYVDATFATKVEYNSIVNGTVKTNAQALQGKAISPIAPTTGQAMCCNGSQWAPKTLGAATVIASGSFDGGVALNFSQPATNFRYIAYVFNGGADGGKYESGDVGFLPAGVFPVTMYILQSSPNGDNRRAIIFSSTSVNGGGSGVGYLPSFITVWGVS